MFTPLASMFSLGKVDLTDGGVGGGGSEMHNIKTLYIFQADVDLVLKDEKVGVKKRGKLLDRLVADGVITQSMAKKLKKEIKEIQDQ